jgi:hypothetical protein
MMGQHVEADVKETDAEGVRVYSVIGVGADRQIRSRPLSAADEE